MGDVVGRPNSRRKVVPNHEREDAAFGKKHEIIAISSTTAPKIAPPARQDQA
jgi:hypothetical protein